MRTEMSLEAKVAILARLESLTGRSPAQLDALAALAEDIVAAPGSVLVHEALGAERWYVVVSGEASVSTSGNVIGSVGPGSVVRDESATVTALTLMHLLALPADEGPPSKEGRR